MGSTSRVVYWTGSISSSTQSTKIFGKTHLCKKIFLPVFRKFITPSLINLIKNSQNKLGIIVSFSHTDTLSKNTDLYRCLTQRYNFYKLSPFVVLHCIITYSLFYHDIISHVSSGIDVLYSYLMSMINYLLVSSFVSFLGSVLTQGLSLLWSYFSSCSHLASRWVWWVCITFSLRILTFSFLTTPGAHPLVLGFPPSLPSPLLWVISSFPSQGLSILVPISPIIPPSLF